MKILRLRSYYFPEISAASHLIDDLDDSFAEAGFTNVNIAPTPSRGISKEERKKYSKIKYEESHDGHQVVYRFSMFAEGKNVIQRAARYFLCGMIEYFKASKFTDTDLIFSSSTPPIQGLVSAMVAHKLRNKTKRVIPFVYNLQDVFPDSLVTTGLTHNGSVIWKIGRKIEDYTYRNANHIITISNSIKNNLIHKGVAPNKITVVSNWIDLNCVHPVPRTENSIISEYSINTDKFLVVYAGNLGAAQGAEVILDAAKLLNYEKRIHIVVFGGGSNYSEFKNNYLFTHREGQQMPPFEQMKDTLQVGDLFAMKHPYSTYRHIMMYIGTLRDFGFTPEETPELAPYLDYPLVAHCGTHPQYGERFQRFIDTHPEDYLNTQEGHNLPVVHCVKGSKGWQIVPQLTEFTQPPAVIIDKPTFGSSKLGQLLQEENSKEGIEQVEVIGLCTDICVISNALLIKAFLPEVPIVVDPKLCAGVTPQSHETALQAMASCQIRIL